MLFSLPAKWMAVGLLIAPAFGGRMSAQDRNASNGNKARDGFVLSLIERMTIEEKVGQMTQLCASSITLDGTKTLDLNVEKIRQLINRYHIGSFISGTGPAAKWHSFMMNLQKASTKSRLKIPLVFGIDHVHGSNYINEGSLFPHNLNMANTFDTSLVRQIGIVMAKEMIPLGLHWNFAPVCDVARTPYWPRFYETFGESPYVVNQMVSAFISASQSVSLRGAKSAACAKHFIGYSNPQSGYDRTPSDISTPTLLNVYAPPFKAAVGAGIKSVMLNSGELNGEPLHASKRYVRNFLRKDIGFEGVIVTDIKDILKLVEMHGAYPDEKAATLAAIQAGIDVSMSCNSTDFIDITLGLVKNGSVSLERIDSSVRRILNMKYDLGLFKNPFPQKISAATFYNKASQDLSLESAQKSLVLLENKAGLPLKPDSQLKVLVAGFASNSKRIMNGPWSWEWQGAAEANQPKHTQTLFEAVKSTYFKASLLEWGDGKSGIEHILEFKDAIKDADFVILTVGEQPYSEFKGNLDNLQLDSTHQELITAMGSKRGTIVLLEGRPRIFSLPVGHQVSVVFAGIPGPRGAEAITSLISGKINPTGRLAFSYPASVGHITTHDRKKSEAYKPRYEFGDGLSFNDREVTDFRIVDSSRKNDGVVKMSVRYSSSSSSGQSQPPCLIFAEGGYNGLTLPVKELVYFGSLNKAEQVVEVSFKQRLLHYNNDGVATRSKGNFMFTCNGKVVQLQID